MNISENKQIFFLIILAAALISIYSFYISPYLVYASIGEQQHYLEISWNLWQQHNWIVLHSVSIDGRWIDYVHKPPLQFWLTKGFWLLFGVSDWSLRCIMLIFALGTVWFTVRSFILLWPEDKEYAWLTGLLLIGCYYFSHYIPYYMQDMPLMFFIAVGFWSCLYSIKHCTLLGWIIFGISSGLAFLTKGPINLLFLAPFIITMPLFFRNQFSIGKNYLILFGYFLLGLLISLAIVFVWLIPLMQQLHLNLLQFIFENVFKHNFYHQHNFWGKYLFVLPMMLFPWIIHPYIWRCVYIKLRDFKWRYWDLSLCWLIVGIVITMLVLSSVPTKSAHYLMPIEMFCVIVLSRIILDIELVRPANFTQFIFRSLNLFYAIGAFFIAAFAYFFPIKLNEISKQNVLPANITHILLIAGILCFLLFLLKPKKLYLYMLVQAGSTIIMVLGFLGIFFKLTLVQSHLIPFSECLQKVQAEGKPIAYRAVYSGYHYRIGKNRIPEGKLLFNDAESIQWQQENPNGVLVSVQQINTPLNLNNVYCQFPSIKKRRFVICYSGKNCIITPKVIPA